MRGSEWWDAIRAGLFMGVGWAVTDAVIRALGF